jgi:hypothetical protein
MLTCAQENEGIKKVRYVPSNAADSTEIHGRQVGASPKRATVHHEYKCAIEYE